MSPYISFEQLVGKPLPGGFWKCVFGGYLTMRYQVMQKGWTLTNFFSLLHFLGLPKFRCESVSTARRPYWSGSGSCLLGWKHDQWGFVIADQYRVIVNKAPEGFRCQVSTLCIPTGHLLKRSELLRTGYKWVRCYLRCQKQCASDCGECPGWTSPTSLLPIDKPHQQLDMHPLQQPWWKEALIHLSTISNGQGRFSC